MTVSAWKIASRGCLKVISRCFTETSHTRLSQGVLFKQLYVDVNTEQQYSTRSAGHQKAPWCGRQHNENPVKFVQPYVDIPLLSEGYDVEYDHLTKANSMFNPIKAGAIEVIPKVLNPSTQANFDIPEVAFVGRSNVGKSTLLSSLLFCDHSIGQLKIRISGKPGRTRSINMYKVGSLYTLVDLPGYGHQMPEHYSESVEPYLAERKQLTRIVMLVDCKTGLTGTDQTGLSMLEEFGRPYTIVLTKIDKVGKHVAIKTYLKVMEEMLSLPGAFPRPFLVSSHLSVGLSHLRCHLLQSMGLLEET